MTFIQADGSHRLFFRWDDIGLWTPKSFFSRVERRVTFEELTAPTGHRHIPAPSWTVRNPPHTGAKTAQVINFESWGVVCLNDGGFAVKSGQPAHWLGRHSMMLVLFISAVALLSLAFVPDLSL